MAVEKDGVKRTLQAGHKTINFYLRPKSETSAEFFHGNRRIGDFRRFESGVWRARFGSCGAMWEGIGEQRELLEAVARFVYFSGERRKLPDDLDDPTPPPGVRHSLLDIRLSTQYPSMDRDLAFEQMKREHLRDVKSLDDEISKVSSQFTKLG